MSAATLTSKGQVTLPKAIREHLEVVPGQRLEFVIDDHGRVVVIAVSKDVRALRKILPTPARPLSIEEIDEAASNSRLDRV